MVASVNENRQHGAEISTYQRFVMSNITVAGYRVQYDLVPEENETILLPTLRPQLSCNTPQDSTNHSQQPPLTCLHAFC
jgi:hypothetical protein